MAPQLPPPSQSSSSSSSAADAKAKRPRTSKPKVKTGCNNCKQRRIKCDEKRPSCSQCVKSKKICTGYPPPARSAWPFEQIRLAPKPTPGAAPPSTPINKQQPVLTRRHQKLTHRQNHQITPPQTPIAPTAVPQGGAVVLYQPAAGLPFDQQEGLYFQLFRSHTANELSGFFDNVFWSRTVLQECHSEEAIRHAVVALGALYKTLEKTAESPPGSPSDDMQLDYIDSAFRHWEVALKQYSYACNALTSVTGQDPHANRTRLTATVLLACFDSFIGDHKQAIVQIQTGLGLLEQLRAERRRSFTPKPEEPVEDELIQMFTRLAIQAKSYDMAFHFPQPYVIRLLPSQQPSDPSSPPPSDGGSGGGGGGSPVSTHQEPIPERFTTLLEARIAWDTLCERIFRFTETMFQYAANGPPNILPTSMTRYGIQFKSQIQAWADAFEPLLGSRTAPGVSSQEKAGIAVLKMFQIMGQILYLMTFSDSEMQFDSFQPQFKAIVDLALEVVGDEERRAAEKRGCTDPRFCPHHKGHGPDIFGGYEYTAHHIKPSFSADLGIVPPLYVVATKSRDRIIRRQAIQLLKSSARREGMWDSELMARIGMWVTEIEEEEEGGGVGGDMFASPPPGDSSPTNTMMSSPQLSTVSSVTANGSSIDFGEMPLGPGGNARWDARRKLVPAEKRILIKACEFDLREHTATLQCGTRGLPVGTPDMKKRVTKIIW